MLFPIETLHPGSLCLNSSASDTLRCPFPLCQEPLLSKQSCIPTEGPLVRGPRNLQWFHVYLGIKSIFHSGIPTNTWNGRGKDRTTLSKLPYLPRCKVKEWFLSHMFQYPNISTLTSSAKKNFETVTWDVPSVPLPEPNSIQFLFPPGEGNGNPLQYSCLENPMDGAACWATVRGVTKCQTWLSGFSFPLFPPGWKRSIVCCMQWL